MPNKQNALDIVVTEALSPNNSKSQPPLRHELLRKQQAKQINFENAQLAKRLMQLRVSKDVSCKLMLEDYEKHLKAKANLCKLPIIDMKLNSFSQKNANIHEYDFNLSGQDGINQQRATSNQGKDLDAIGLIDPTGEGRVANDNVIDKSEAIIIMNNNLAAE